MRWKNKEQKYHPVRKFLWKPISYGKHTRWLEWAWVAKKPGYRDFKLIPDVRIRNFHHVEGQGLMAEVVEIVSPKTFIRSKGTGKIYFVNSVGIHRNQRSLQVREVDVCR